MGPQKERRDAAIYFPLNLVLVTPDVKSHSIFYLPADLKDPAMFQARSHYRPPPGGRVGRDLLTTSTLYDNASLEFAETVLSSAEFSGLLGIEQPLE
jgi:hypothetical protein